MRKSKEDAAETRRRIVTVAAAEFRKNGIVATGINDVMKAAGLTHGGFYKHFASKDQLVAEACAEGMGALVGRLTNAGTSAVATYLSLGHKDHPAEGCPLAAIGSELGRLDARTRAVATDGLRKLVEIMSEPSGEPLPDDDTRRRALAAVSTMIGAITMARVVDDPELAAEILRAAEQSVSRK